MRTTGFAERNSPAWAKGIEEGARVIAKGQIPTYVPKLFEVLDKYETFFEAWLAMKKVARLEAADTPG